MSNTRIITVYSTKGKKKAKIETDATTWGELSKLISKEGYDLKNLLATENINRTSLVNDLAVLPTGEFTVFMRPEKTKSGALSYKEAKAQIKQDIADFAEVAKTHYGNYTTQTTDNLNKLVESFVRPAAQKTDAASEVPSTATESIQAEEVASTPVKTITNSDRIVQIATLLGEVAANTSNADVIDRTTDMLEELNGLKAEVDGDITGTVTTVADVVESVKESATAKATREAKEAREAKEEADKIAKAEAKRLEDEEDTRLEAEAKEFM